MNPEVVRIITRIVNAFAANSHKELSQDSLSHFVNKIAQPVERIVALPDQNQRVARELASVNCARDLGTVAANLSTSPRITVDEFEAAWTVVYQESQPVGGPLCNA